MDDDFTYVRTAVGFVYVAFIIDVFARFIVGWDALSVDGWKGGQARMTSAQETELCAWLDGRFCRSAAPIMAHIAAQYGLEYSHSGCIKLLARLGFEYRKPKGLPRVASPEQQAAFIDMYERLLNGLGAHASFKRATL